MKKLFGAYIRKVSYRYIIYFCIFCVVSILTLVFGLYTYYDYRRECLENARREADNTAARVVGQIDERFENLAQYYLYVVSTDDTMWVLENNIKFSDYNYYNPVMELLASATLFGDYISGYALVNFKTDWILNSKGIYKLEEAVNAAELEELFGRETGVPYKNYWYYNDSDKVTNMIDRNYRLTIETAGLNFVMRLPVTSSKVYGMLAVNVDMDAWKNWIGQLADENDNVVVVDADGRLIYASDENLAEPCLALAGAGEETDSVKMGGVFYGVSSKTSNVLGWKYYVFRELQQDRFWGARFPVSFLVMLGFVIAVMLMVFSYVIYWPVGSLVQNVSGDKRRMRENELQFLAGKFETVMDDKRVLQEAVSAKQKKLQELFELRMIRGEISGEEEWKEYVNDLGLRSWKYFATAVIVLNLREEEESQSCVDEDVICLKLVEEMPETLAKKAWMMPVYNACTIFAIFAEEDENRLLERIKEFYTGMQEYSAAATGYHILMGVSGNHTNYHHIRAAYRESINALTNTFAGDAEMTEASENLRDCHFYLASFTLNGQPYDASFEKEIRNGIKAVDKEACYNTTGEFIAHLAKQQSSQAEKSVSILQYVNAILLTAMEARLNIEQIFPDGIRKIYFELLEVVEPERERRYIKRNIIDPILEERNMLLEKRSYSMMEEIEKLLSESKGNISLTECADALGVHPTYIWKILKMEKGTSFAEYLEEYKLEEAKRLLLNTSMSVAEIAAELNYTNAQNFIRFFSKCTGVTPGKFRKLY